MMDGLSVTNSTSSSAHTSKPPAGATDRMQCDEDDLLVDWESSIASGQSASVLPVALPVPGAVKRRLHQLLNGTSSATQGLSSPTSSECSDMVREAAAHYSIHLLCNSFTASWLFYCRMTQEQTFRSLMMQMKNAVQKSYSAVAHTRSCRNLCKS